MPIIVGVPRSGTTLLRFMLDSHPCLAIPPETGFLAWPLHWLTMFAPRESLFRAVTRLPFKSGPWADFGLGAREFRQHLRQVEPFDLGEGLRTFYRLYAEQQNKIRYGDKTPLYCKHMKSIAGFLPEAHFLHIIRDGRDVALSLRTMPFAPAKDIPALAVYWRKLIQKARRTRSQCGAYMEVRYESLVQDPAAVLRSICSFIKLDFDVAMLRYWERSAERLREHRSRVTIGNRVLVTHEQRMFQQRLTLEAPEVRRIFDWKNKMTLAERAQFLRVAGDLLQELGYET
ncbi:MAG: sulfotransferase [Terriglobales bacterium]